MVISTRMNTTKSDFYGKARHIYEILSEEEIEKIEIESLEWSEISTNFGEYEKPIAVMQGTLEAMANEVDYQIKMNTIDTNRIFHQQREFEKSWLGCEPTFLHKPFGYR